MTEPLPSRTETALIDLVHEAGDAIMQVYRSDFDVQRKDDASPLTQADLAAHSVLETGLQRLMPAVPVLSEESGPDVTGRLRMDWTRLWLVDPLDGTREFVNRRDEFTVNVALIDAHRPVFGLVHLPALGLTYGGGAGLGAWRLERGSPARPVACSTPPADPPRVLGSRSHPDPHLAGYLERLGAHTMQAAGSSLKFCRLAEGAADVYPRFGPTSEWDTAAGQAVLEGAGGRVTDLCGRPLEYNRRETLLNPYFLALADPDTDWLAWLPDALRAQAAEGAGCT